MHKSKSKKPKHITQQILNALAHNPKSRFTPKQLKKKLKVEDSIDSIRHHLDQLETQGKVFQVKDGRYKHQPTQHKESSAPAAKTSRRGMTTIVGKVDLTRSGAAYIVTDQSESDIYIPERSVNGAFQGDMVEVQCRLPKGNRRPEGVITKILERGVKDVIGVLKIYPKFGIVYPNGNKRLPDIHIPLDKIPEEASDNNYVLAHITEYGRSQNKGLWGEVGKVLHEMSHNEMTMQSILLEQGFDLEFPPEVVKSTEHMSAEVTEQQLALRRDVRAVPTFTIDPLTARDFDDALSIRRLQEEALWEIGIHIADVTHYVEPGSPLDKEAAKRTTSVYLVDRVCPMLPEKLSNDLCSLVPHQDRYTFSAIFHIDDELNIKKEWFGKSIIHSDRRFTYEEAQEIIENKEGEYKEEILQLNRIAVALRKKRFKNGAINFESDEVQFELDEAAKPIRAYTKQRKEAHMLVEEFMLLANKHVAKFVAKRAKPEIPFVYRIHDEPDLDKLQDFRLFASEMGFHLQIDTPRQIAKSLNKLAAAAEKDPALKLLEPLAIRTMAKAVYSTNNIGHYGLAFDHYTHFTSPIRRYADVLVHRILLDNIGQIMRPDAERLESLCKHISNQEKKATDAERASKKYKQAEYIESHIGEVFEGRLSGMIDRGFFVELSESKAEGFIPFDRLNEPFVMADSRLRATGKYSKTTLKMGDAISVKVESVDLDDRTIELSLIKPEL